MGMSNRNEFLEDHLHSYRGLRLPHYFVDCAVVAQGVFLASRKQSLPRSYLDVNRFDETFVDTSSLQNIDCDWFIVNV